MGVSKIELIIRMEKLTELKAALSKHGVEGMTVFPVLGCGAEKGTKEYEVDKNFVMELLPKCQVNLLVETEKVKEIVEFVKEELYTGHIGYGKIVVYRLDNVVRVRTGEEGAAAIKVFLAVVLGALGVYMALTQGVANEVNVGSLLSPFLHLRHHLQYVGIRGHLYVCRRHGGSEETDSKSNHHRRHRHRAGHHPGGVHHLHGGSVKL